MSNKRATQRRERARNQNSVKFRNKFFCTSAESIFVFFSMLPNVKKVNCTMRERVQERRTSPKQFNSQGAYDIFNIFSTKGVKTNLCIKRIPCIIEYDVGIIELKYFFICYRVDAALRRNLLRIGVVIRPCSLITIHAPFSVL